VVLLIGAVLGSIYSGIATATEAAAVGVVGALVLSACRAR
jgi:C4-dicarboxylate transporter DctM subunit